MNKYTIVSLVALLMVVAALPVYALYEAGRMEEAQEALAERYVAEGADMYVENCASCHGADGKGVGAMPALNNPGLAKADREVLYDTIAHSPHGTVMSAWHVDEGGALSSFQVEGLVTLIMNADWTEVRRLATMRGFREPAVADPKADLAAMEGEGQDPHECRACHEEPELHAERFGLNCSRCHTLESWKPALLLRHTFALEHGDQGQVACQTCHTENYYENTCYGCHDHEAGEMAVAHEAEGIHELDGCSECHPTGAKGEARALGYGLGGQSSGLSVPGLSVDGHAVEPEQVPAFGDGTDRSGEAIGTAQEPINPDGDSPGAGSAQTGR